MRQVLLLKRSFFGAMLLFYLAILLLYGLLMQNKVPPYPILMLQIASVFIIYFFSFLYSKKSIVVTCIIIFLFQLIVSYGLRYFNLEYFNNPLGYKPADARSYHMLAMRFMHSSFHELNMFMDSFEFMLDDRGMNYICYFIYRIGGTTERALNLMVFVNVCCITASSYFTYKLSNVFVESKYALTAAFLWGTQLYSTYTAASGLKENFMVLFLIASLYYLAILYNDFSIKNIALSVLFAASALFFRMALFYMLLASILFVVAVKFPIVRKYIYFLLIALVALTWVSYQRTFDEMAVLRRGADAMDYDTYQGLVENKMNQAGFFASIVSYLSAFIGPLPNIVAAGEKVNYITLFSFSSFCKSFYAFFFLYAIYLAIKQKKFDIMAILVFWFLDIIMLIVTFFTLHDRYHWPHVPIVITLAIWGATQWRVNKTPKLVQYTYFCTVIIIISIFNFR